MYSIIKADDESQQMMEIWIVGLILGTFWRQDLNKKVKIKVLRMEILKNRVLHKEIL